MIAATVLNASILTGPIPAASCSAIKSSSRLYFWASDKVNTLDSLTESMNYDTKYAATTPLGSRGPMTQPNRYANNARSLRTKHHRPSGLASVRLGLAVVNRRFSEQGFRP
jgi:hypothetical protein